MQSNYDFNITEQFCEMFINKILVNKTNENEIKPSHGRNHKDIIQQQQRTPPEVGPLAASGCCWVTSGSKDELATRFILKYQSRVTVDYNKKSLNLSAIIHSLCHPQFWSSNSSSIPSFESLWNHPEIILKSSASLISCCDLNKERSESSYNQDKYNMISITKLDCFQPIDK